MSMLCFQISGSLYFGRTQFSRLFGGCIRCHVSCGGARNSLCTFIYSRPSRILGSVLHSCNKIDIIILNKNIGYSFTCKFNACYR